MELKTFISATLTQILEGIVDAQEKSKETGGRIIPRVRSPKEIDRLYGHTNDKLPVILVDFEVSVFAEEGTATKGGIGLVIGVLAVGSKGESNQQQKSTNQIRFQIPVALPLQKYDSDN